MATALKAMEPMAAATTIKDQVSAEEWALRVDLAAAYRLVALYGWDDLIFTHLSARVPGRTISASSSAPLADKPFNRTCPSRTAHNPFGGSPEP